MPRSRSILSVVVYALLIAGAAVPLGFALWQRADRDSRRPTFDPDLAERLVSHVQDLARQDEDWWKRDEAINLLTVLRHKGAALKPILESAVPATPDEARRRDKLLDLIR